MRASQLFELLLVGMASLAASSPAPALITPAAKRQDADPTTDPLFIGWFSTEGDYDRWDCRSGSAFQTSSSFGRCCLAGTTCVIGTTCLRGSIIANRNQRTTCSGTAAQASCVTGTIYHTLGDQAPIMNYQCWPEWNKGNWEAVRATTTGASSGSIPPTTGSSLQSILPSDTTLPSETPEPEPSSQAWIAGPVVGGVVGIALVAGAAFWLIRRRNKKKAEAYANPPPPGYEKVGGFTTYGHEASAETRPVETEANPVYEMPSQAQNKEPVELEGGGAVVGSGSGSGAR